MCDSWHLQEESHKPGGAVGWYARLSVRLGCTCGCPVCSWRCLWWCRWWGMRLDWWWFGRNFCDDCFFKSIDRNCILFPVHVQYEIFGVSPEYLVRTRIWWSKTRWYAVVGHKYMGPLVDVQRDICFYALWMYV